MLQLTSSINLLEIIWSVMCLVGVTLHVLGLRDFYGDRRVAALDAIATGVPTTKAALIILRGNIRHAWSRLVIKTSLLLVGFAQMAAVDPSAPLNASVMMSRILMITALSYMLFDAWSDRRDRAALIAEELRVLSSDT